MTEHLILCTKCGQNRPSSEFSYYFNEKGDKIFGNVCIPCQINSIDLDRLKKPKATIDNKDDESGGKRSKQRVDARSKYLGFLNQSKAEDKILAEKKDYFEKEEEKEAEKDESRENKDSDSEKIKEKKTSHEKTKRTSAYFGDKTANNDSSSTFNVDFDQSGFQNTVQRNFESIMWLCVQGSNFSAGPYWGSKILSWLAFNGSMSAIAINWVNEMKKQFSGRHAVAYEPPSEDPASKSAESATSNFGFLSKK